jgi:hypothetical protein
MLRSLLVGKRRGTVPAAALKSDGASEYASMLLIPRSSGKMLRLKTGVGGYIIKNKNILNNLPISKNTRDITRKRTIFVLFNEKMIVFEVFQYMTFVLYFDCKVR